MTDMIRIALRFCCVAVLGLAAGGVAKAEVAVAVDPSAAGRVSALYVLGVIDDPDPVTPVWRRFSPPGPGRVVLNEQGEANGDGLPSVLATPGFGEIVVAWARNSPSGFDVVVSRFVGGAWSAPEVVAGSGVDEIDPVLVEGPDGAIHLFYWESAPVPRVMHRRAAPGLSSWTVARQISEPGIAACRPSAIFHEGVLRVAYELHDYGYGQTPRQLLIAREAGDDFEREVLAVTQNPGDLWPQVHGAPGRIWVDWIESDTRMGWLRKVGLGPWETIQSQPYTGPEDLRYFVRGTIRSQALQ